MDDKMINNNINIEELAKEISQSVIVRKTNPAEGLYESDDNLKQRVEIARQCIVRTLRTHFTKIKDNEAEQTLERRCTACERTEAECKESLSPRIGFGMCSRCVGVWHSDGITNSIEIGRITLLQLKEESQKTHVEEKLSTMHPAKAQHLENYAQTAKNIASSASIDIFDGLYVKANNAWQQADDECRNDADCDKAADESIRKAVKPLIGSANARAEKSEQEVRRLSKLIGSGRPIAAELELRDIRISQLRRLLREAMEKSSCVGRISTKLSDNIETELNKDRDNGT